MECKAKAQGHGIHHATKHDSLKTQRAISAKTCKNVRLKILITINRGINTFNLQP